MPIQKQKTPGAKRVQLTIKSVYSTLWRIWEGRIRECMHGLLLMQGVNMFSSEKAGSLDGAKQKNVLLMPQVTRLNVAT